MPMPPEISLAASIVPRDCRSWGCDERLNPDGTVSLVIYANSAVVAIVAAMDKPLGYDAMVNGVGEGILDELGSAVRGRPRVDA